MMYFDHEGSDDYYEFEDLVRKNNSSDMLSLKNRCLLSICKNLARFNLAFSTTQDPAFQKNLQFLRRFYSSYLIKAVTTWRKKLDESYFDFLLNQYIKEFNMDVLYHCDHETVIKRMSEVGHGFQKVCLKFSEKSKKVFDFINKILPYLPNVKALDVTMFGTDSTLEIIGSSCLQLQELNIDLSFAVTDKGLKALCQVNDDNVGRLNLKRLSMLRGGANEGVGYILQNMPSLEEIVHPQLPYILYNMHRDDMSNTLDRKYNLTSLRLDRVPLVGIPTLTGILTLFRDVCPHIKSVTSSLTSKEQLDLCLGFLELEDFCVYNDSDPLLNLDLDEFLTSRGGLLRKLRIYRFSLSVAVLLQNCPKLETLFLNDITFQHLETATTFQPLNNLQELRLEFFDFSEALVRRSVIAILNSSQKVEKLYLHGCKFKNNDEFITRLSKFCEKETLKYLEFYDCDVDDVFLQSILLACSNLKTLVIKYCNNISPAHVDNLREISNSLKSKTEITWTDDRREYGRRKFNFIDDAYRKFLDRKCPSLYFGFDRDDY